MLAERLILDFIWKMASNVREQADLVKAAANEAFKADDLERAKQLYSEAIDIDPTCAIYYSNRAMCHLKLESFGAAIQDASMAIEIDPEYVKGYHRRATAYHALGKYKSALKDFKHVHLHVDSILSW